MCTGSIRLKGVVCFSVCLVGVIWLFDNDVFVLVASGLQRVFFFLDIPE